MSNQSEPIKKPFWYPRRTDANWCNHIRGDYPEATEGMDDEAIVEEYADGQEYWTGWDHTGDAYSDYKPLADAFLAQQQRIEELEAENARLMEALKGIESFGFSRVPITAAMLSEAIYILQEKASAALSQPKEGKV